MLFQKISSRVIACDRNEKKFHALLYSISFEHDQHQSKYFSKLTLVQVLLTILMLFLLISPNLVNECTVIFHSYQSASLFFDPLKTQ